MADAHVVPFKGRDPWNTQMLKELSLKRIAFKFLQAWFKRLRMHFDKVFPPPYLKGTIESHVQPHPSSSSCGRPVGVMIISLLPHCDPGGAILRTSSFWVQPHNSANPTNLGGFAGGIHLSTTAVKLQFRSLVGKGRVNQTVHKM